MKKTIVRNPWLWIWIVSMAIVVTIVAYPVVARATCHRVAHERARQEQNLMKKDWDWMDFETKVEMAKLFLPVYEEQYDLAKLYCLNSWGIR